MGSSSDDEDLERAIALSLQDQPNLGLAANGFGLTLKEVIQFDSETKDEEETVAAAKQIQRRLDPKHMKELQPSVANMIRNRAGELAESEGPKTTSGLGFLGLDRKKMEQERLARKRKASISPPPPRKTLRTSPGPSFDTPALLRSTKNKQVQAQPKSQVLPEGNDSVALAFPRGTVKKTWAFGYPRTGDDIKVEEVLEKNDLNLAVLSSFQWDIEWLLAKINTRSTQLTLVMQAKDEATKQQYRRETASMPNLRLCFPSMEGQVNCMHSKLMLLSHPGYLRVAVPTANLVNYDWGESGEMENLVFLIDLPRLSGSQRITPEDLTFFGREMIYFLEAMGLERSIIDSVYNFDFSASKDLAFVHTIGGTHIGVNDPWRRTGYCGLGRAIGEIGLATDRPLNIDFVTSSVGSLETDFLAMLYLAAHGDDGNTEYQWRNPAMANGRGKAAAAITANAKAYKEKVNDEVRENFRIYFPTHDTVRSSKAGFAGTICFQSNWYNSPTFPHQVMRDCKSIRVGLLMHNKILYVCSKDETSSLSTPRSTAWAYVGSANCSESAWGKLFKDRSSKSPKLNCRNWECGVIVPIRMDEGSAGRVDLQNFEGTVPVPMQYPGASYGSRQPWFYSEQ